MNLTDVAIAAMSGVNVASDVKDFRLDDVTIGGKPVGYRPSPEAASVAGLSKPANNSSTRTASVSRR